jgi:predicted ABC-type ATPase
MVGLINRAKEAGFSTRIIFIDVTVETSIRRNEVRAAAGGRRVPLKVIEQKGQAIPATMKTVMPLCDNAETHDNNEEKEMN